MVPAAFYLRTSISHCCRRIIVTSHFYLHSLVQAKVENLVQIWERGNTFPQKLLVDLKKKLNEPTLPSRKPLVCYSSFQNHDLTRFLEMPSSTPPGSPPMNLLISLGLRQPLNHHTVPQPPASAPAIAAPPAQPDASSILAALAGLQPVPATAPPQSAPPPAAVPPQPLSQAPSASSGRADLTALLAGIGQPYSAPPPSIPPTPTNPVAQQQPYGHPYNPPMPAAVPQSFHPYYQAPTPVQQAPPPPPPAQNPLGALASLLPPHVLSNPATLTQVLTLLQGLQQEGIPQEQWGAVIAALYPPPQQNNGQASTPTWGAPQDGYQQRSDNHGGYRDRSRDRARGRSRSPDWRRERNTNRRPSPVYGVYDASAAQSQSDSPASSGLDKKGKVRGRAYRQRTPPSTTRNGHQDSPGVPVQGLAPKWTDIDPTLPPGHIKVLSRTLFVGGATGSEQELRAIFSRFGQVQTCIANEDKRHAFVKMCTRSDAVAAKTAMENVKDHDILSKARQTKWGVGFGPRECCDYSNGISIIPIDTLTDADHKWMVTAEFGGTGGRPIESGLVVEEPDIEIGAGVSSKGKNNNTTVATIEKHANLQMNSYEPSRRT